MADPASVTGLVNRWRADTIGQANGSAVVTWPAMVGGIALTQATSAKQPTYQTAGVGGMPAVRFVTASSHDLGSSAEIIVPQPLTLIVVAKLNRTDSAIQQLVDGNSMQIITLTAGFDFFAGADASGGVMTLSPTVLTFVMNAASSVAAQDGTTFSTANVGSGGGLSTWHVGASSAGARFLDGLIAEILVYNRALSAADRATVHTYVQDRYGITVGDYGAALSASLVLAPSAGAVPIATTATCTASGGTGTAKTYAWNWGDGTTDPAAAANSKTHTYTTAGTYTVTVTVANT